ncbi:hypothetical protein EVAR_77045_1 [Eumeta japonica]|uniref:Uncharacterized protein n=1 Tax=Eumeta variegata TaxID=151549 RepID=A0A4C2AAS1_EUMVA|nr:hypothetical protein EVAR_77045_1 [Eumeta japonica]
MWSGYSVRVQFCQSTRSERTPPRARSQCSRSTNISFVLFTVQIAAPLCPATLPALPTESPLRRWPPRFTATNYILFISESNHWLPNGVNEVICSVTRALAFPLQGTANPDGPGTTGLGGCSSPIPGVARPPSTIPHSILCSPFASIPLFAHLRAELREAGPRRRLLFAPANNRHQLSTCVGY